MVSHNHVSASINAGMGHGHLVVGYDARQPDHTLVKCRHQHIHLGAQLFHVIQNHLQVTHIGLGQHARWRMGPAALVLRLYT